MTKILGAVLALFMGACAYAADVAYMRGATAPWGQATNEAAMDAAFGAGNWDDLRMANGVGPFLPGSGYRFIFLEGGDDTAIELDNYLQANLSAIEAFVSGGGHLIINSAPNQGGNIDFGFGGVTLTNGLHSGTVEAANPTHSVFTGPLSVGVTTFSGSSFAHAVVGPGLSSILDSVDNHPGEVVLGELNYGDGIVLFGGMTTSNFHSPQPDADNLRANIIYYAANGAYVSSPVSSPKKVPVNSPLALVILIGLMGLVALRARRSFS